MNLIEKATIIHYHRHRIESYSNEMPEALGWKTEDSQIKRFEALSTVGDLKDCTVLDVGCGYGDLKTYLDQKFSDFIYTGIDQMPEFIAAAQERFKDCPNTYFYQTDFTTVALPTVDYVFASGALSYRCADPDFYTRMIRKMFEVATRALVFNMLDSACFPEHRLLVGHDCDEITAFCHYLSSNVRVDKAYQQDYFTMFLYKPRIDS